jgi:sensor histidine kinase YesM
MQPTNSSRHSRYTRIEWVFFLGYYLVFPVLSSLEMAYYETFNQPLGLPEKLIYGLVAMIPAWICYKTVIQRYLFEKKYLKFVGALALFLILLKIYNLVMYWIISKLGFLPGEMATDAARYFSVNLKTNNLYHIVSIYMLREFVVLSALAFFLKSARQDTEIAELKQAQLNSELNYLKVQLQPHFFFNTLNNIYALTLQRSEKAAPLVAKHSEMMRYILHESTAPTVSLRQEIAFLKNYIEVEAIRYPEKIDISFESQGITDLAVIEPLLLLPFIENTFKHGVSEETGDGYVHVVIVLNDGELHAEIKNSKSLNSANQKKESGIGLQNAAKRLDLLYPGRHTVEVIETASSYETRLSLILKADD